MVYVSTFSKIVVLRVQLFRGTISRDVTQCGLVEIYRHSSETSASFYRTTANHIEEDSNLNSSRRENVKSHNAASSFHYRRYFSECGKPESQFIISNAGELNSYRPRIFSLQSLKISYTFYTRNFL
jgi:hypothetical protein